VNTNLEDLKQFSALDPAAGREPGPAEWNRSRMGLERVMDDAVPRRPVRVVTSRRFAVGLVAAAAVAVTGTLGVPALFPNAAAKAVADWTPVPGSLTGADVLPQAKACADTRVGGLDPGVVTADQVVLAEQRGVATMLILKQGAAAMAQCMTVGVDDDFASMALDESHPASASKPITIESQSSHGSGDDQFSTVTGRIDPSVTGVDLILGDGQVIQTSAKASWWGAWWPGPAGGEVDTFTIRVHTAKGTTDYRSSQLFHN
jgi:hypothetical protein